MVSKQCPRALTASSERGRGEMEREGEIERERERGREGERVLMLEPSTSYFNAPWWMVDSCTASIG